MCGLALIITLLSFLFSLAMVSSESKKRLKVVLVILWDKVTRDFKYALSKIKNDNGCWWS